MKNKREYDYFEQFITLSNFSLELAEKLHSNLTNFNVNNLPKELVEMHNIEHSADIAKHEMINRLIKEFLPPIEREDIISISQKIDDVTDSIEDIMIRIDMFNIQTIRPEIVEFSNVIVNCCSSLKVAVEELRNFRKSTTLRNKIIEINRLEEEGDTLYINSVRKLYRTVTDPIDLMVWTDILYRFEKCCDACEAAADDIESIMMKNS